MKILAFDSTAKAASVAVCENERLLALYNIDNGMTHSELLLPMAENILSSLKLDISDIDLFATAVGPGSFTGVRIGTSLIKGLAFGKNKPCVSVSTLEAIAENLCVYKGLICPVMNARLSQVYTALFRSDGEKLTRLTPDSAISIAELDELLAKYAEPVAFCGDGYDITVSALEKTELYPVPERLRHQSAYSVAQVALRNYLAGNHTDDAKLTVTYLRPSQAERERMERERTRSTLS